MRDTVLFLAVFLLGCGIVGLAGLAVLLIWREQAPMSDRVERFEVDLGAPPSYPAGFPAATCTLSRECADPLGDGLLLFAHQLIPLKGVTNRPHPYDWKTREPMIWGRS